MKARLNTILRWIETPVALLFEKLHEWDAHRPRHSLLIGGRMIHCPPFLKLPVRYNPYFQALNPRHWKSPK
jgi:hypothetical protein